jgi:hypothetical protein
LAAAAIGVEAAITETAIMTVEEQSKAFEQNFKNEKEIVYEHRRTKE